MIFCAISVGRSFQPVIPKLRTREQSKRKPRAKSYPTFEQGVLYSGPGTACSVMHALQLARAVANAFVPPLVSRSFTLTGQLIIRNIDRNACSGRSSAHLASPVQLIKQAVSNASIAPITSRGHYSTNPAGPPTHLVPPNRAAVHLANIGALILMNRIASSRSSSCTTVMLRLESWSVLRSMPY